MLLKQLSSIVVILLHVTSEIDTLKLMAYSIFAEMLAAECSNSTTGLRSKTIGLKVKINVDMQAHRRKRCNLYIN